MEPQFGFEPNSTQLQCLRVMRRLVEQVNANLAEIKADGTFDELVKTYIEAE